MTTETPLSKSNLAFDPDALREKYRLERDKRVRPDGAEQYIEMSGQWATYAESDPYAGTAIEREPITDDVNVVIIGGGFSGLLASARMMEAGVEDFHIIEAGSDYGGTWYWNRYPGAQCDIESYCYLPLLEELNYMPKEKYSFGTEIFEHSQRIGRHYGLYERTWFQTRVRSLDWDDGIKRWHISTDRGDEIRARHVVMALGTASRAKLPGIPGLDEFEGHTFHTSRWDYAYTGGNTEGGMTGLADKRVAIIGTGASAIQCVPRVAQYAKELVVFQRTPSSVDLRGNKPTDPEWWQSLQPGWQRARRDNFGAVLTGAPVEEDLVADGWTDVMRRLRSMMFITDRKLTPEEMAEMAEIADFEKMEEIRNRVAETVSDDEVAEVLKPYYRQFCKRPTFNDEYLPCFNQENVTLVDVSGTKGVERITPKGVSTGGKEYEFDCIIYASGFEITTRFERRLGFAINGRDGVSLYDHWRNGMKTLHGFSTRGFPNWFYIGSSQNAFSANMTAMFDAQARHIAYIIAETQRRGGTTVEPTLEGQDAWVKHFTSMQMANASFQDSCTPGYYNNEGGPRGGIAGGTYLPGINHFNQVLEEWRSEGSMAGLEIDRR